MVAGLVGMRLYGCSTCRTFGDYVFSSLVSLAIALLLVGYFWWYRKRRRARSSDRPASRSPKGTVSEPLADSMLKKGITLVVDKQPGGGCRAWSTDMTQISVDAPTLDAIDNKVRQSIRERRAGHENNDVSIAYVWQDSQSANSTSGTLHGNQGERAPKNIYLEVREEHDGGYVAEGSGLRVAGPTLEALLPATQSAIATRWPTVGAQVKTAVTFSWVRSVQV